MAKVFDDIEITKEDGTVVKMKILFTFESTIHKKDYVLFYNPDDPSDENLYAYGFDEYGNLMEVETQEEWEEIQLVYESYLDDLDEEDE